MAVDMARLGSPHSPRCVVQLDSRRSPPAPPAPPQMLPPNPPAHLPVSTSPFSRVLLLHPPPDQGLTALQDPAGNVGAPPATQPPPPPPPPSGNAAGTPPPGSAFPPAPHTTAASDDATMDRNEEEGGTGAVDADDDQFSGTESDLDINLDDVNEESSDDASDAEAQGTSNQVEQSEGGLTIGTEDVAQDPEMVWAVARLLAGLRVPGQRRR
jgi:hypothetical protein